MIAFLVVAALLRFVAQDGGGVSSGRERSIFGSGEMMYVGLSLEEEIQI